MTFPGLIKVKLLNKCETSFFALRTAFIWPSEYYSLHYQQAFFRNNASWEEKKNQDERDSLT